MEKSLTAAERVRRRIKAGRPRRIFNVALSTEEALHRLVSEAERARTMMEEADLDPQDINLAVVYCTPEMPGFENVPRYRRLPEKGERSTLAAALQREASESPILYLGILWVQLDREAPEAKTIGVPAWPVCWVTQFIAGPKAEEMLFAARNHFISGGSKALDN